MIKYLYFPGSIFLLMLLSMCSNKIEEVNELFEKKELEIEYATDVQVIYSDSAKVRLKVKGEVLERYRRL